MRKYKSVEVIENQMEDLVRTGSEMIEEGLKYVDHRKIPGKDQMDVLFVDSGNSMVAAELNIVEDDNMLLQGLDYYNYVATNIEALSGDQGNFSILVVRPSNLGKRYDIDRTNKVCNFCKNGGQSLYATFFAAGQFFGGNA